MFLFIQAMKGFLVTHQISAGQLSADSSSTETLYCLNSVQRLSQSDYSICIGHHHLVLFPLREIGPYVH